MLTYKRAYIFKSVRDTEYRERAYDRDSRENGAAG